MNNYLFIENFEDLTNKRNQNKNVYYESPTKKQIITGFFISEVKPLIAYNASSQKTTHIDLYKYSSTDNKKVSADNLDRGFDTTYSKEDFFINKSEQIQKAISRYKKQLRVYLQNFDYSPENLSLAEKKISEVVNTFSFEILGNILQSISMENYDKPNILCGICHSLERFDLDDVYPWGTTLMLSILLHKDENVKAYAISTIDNWADRSLLSVLKNIDCSSDWLKGYIEDVISVLEV